VERVLGLRTAQWSAEIDNPFPDRLISEIERGKDRGEEICAGKDGIATTAENQANSLDWRNRSNYCNWCLVWSWIEDPKGC
jgi:malate synthase